MYKKILTIALAIAVCGSVLAQKKGKVPQAPVQEEWNDVEIFEQHKVYPRSIVIPYGDENAIEHNGYDESPYYVSLNGEWQFLETAFNQRPVDIETKDFAPKNWKSIVLPTAHHLDPITDKMRKPLKANGSLNPDDNIATTYYRQFDVPKSWKDYKAYLNLQAKSAVYVWLNGEYVGYSEDSRDISEFELTKHLRIGKSNSIVVQVLDHSDGALLESVFSHRYKGITSDIFIVLKPKVNVTDFRISASYNTANKSGEFSVGVDVFNEAKKGQVYVEMEIWDPRGRQVEKVGRWTVFDKKNELEMNFERLFAKVEPWTAETPNMYTMILRLRDENLNLIETVGSRFGFRNVALRDGLLCVNGVPVTLRGVNYTFYDVEGNGIPSRERVRRDLSLMKQNNINAIRTTLYSPAAPYFYELCDEFGLYVVCDANINPLSTQARAVATDKAYINLFVSRVQNMYERLKNHPSIIAWSLGDSPDNGICMENAYRTLKRMDKQRPVIFPGAGYSESSDFVVAHGLNFDDLKFYAAKQQERPLVMSSFGMAMGNSYGSLEPLWTLVRRHSCLQGGFADSWNRAEFNQIEASSSEQVVYGFMTKDDIAVPYLSELRNIYRPFDVKLLVISPDAAEFSVSNYLSFLTLNDYILEYKIFSTLKNRIIEGEVSVALNPGETKNFKLKIPALTLYAGEELFIRFTIRQRNNYSYLPKGTELGVKEFKIPMREVKKESLADYDREELYALSQFDDAPGIVRVHNDHIDLQYDLNLGEVVSYRFNDKEMLLSSPIVNFWRGPTDNDRADKNALRLWRNLGPDGLRREVLATNWRQIDPYTVGIDAMMRFSDASGLPYFDLKQSIAILHTGDVIIDNEVVATENVKTLPKLGMQMCLPKWMDSVSWFGLDKETYVDRHSAGVSGLYREAAQSMFFAYDNPQESGNRSNVRWVSVFGGNTAFYVDMLDTNFNFSIYPYADLQLSNLNGSTSLREQDYWTFNVDYRQAAIGTALAGVEIADSNILDAKKYHFRLHMRAYDPTEYNPYDFCRVEYPTIVSSVLPMPVISKNRDRFDGPMTITMRCDDPKAEIRYTLDGSTPDENSLLYKKPFVIDHSAYVKAKAFKKDATPSFTTIKRYNFDYIVSSSFSKKPNTPYNFNQEGILFDGENGDISELSRGWLGFSGNDLDVVFELSKPIELQQVVVNFAHVPDAWAFAPTAVEAYVSSDGVEYSPAINAKIKYAPEEESMNKPQLVTVTIDAERSNVRFVRLVAKNMGRIPVWHKAKGLRPWIMVDEIQLNEVIR